MTDKSKKITKEVQRLTKIYKDVDSKKKLVVEGLINEAAFMRATLEELRIIIDEAGPVDEMQQGSYSIFREHPAIKTYNTMIQRYSGVISQLNGLLPKITIKEQDDGFESFVNSRE